MSVLKQTSPRASVAVGGVFDLSDLRGEAERAVVAARAEAARIVDAARREAAQQKIVDIVRRLEEAGEIIIAGRGGDNDVVV